MYRSKMVRGRKAVRLTAGAIALAACASGMPRAWGDSTFIASYGNWSTSTNWSPTGVPGVGSTAQTVVADIFTAVNVIYNVPNTSGVDLKALQIAGGNASNPAVLTLTNSSALQVLNIYLGGTNAGVSSTGPGVITDTGGTINIDPGGVLAVDSSSTFTMGSAGSLIANNEQLNGVFTENGGSNTLTAGSTLTNSGNYVLESSGTLGADTIVNNGTFNFSSGSVRGTTTTSTSFLNYGSFIISGSGTFTGAINNTAGSTVLITNTAIPFTNGLINNGQLTLSGTTGSYAGAITGTTGNITFSGSGNTTLTGANNFNGSTSITSGSVTLAGPAGTAANNFGGSLQGNITVGSAGTLLLGGSFQIASTSSLQINGGIFNLAGYNDSIGSLTLYSGQVIQSGGMGLSVANGLVTALGRSTATITGGLRASSLAGSTLSFAVANGGTLTVNGPISGYATNTSTGLIVNGSGGTLAISGASLLSSIDIKNGFLQFTQGGMLGGYNASTNVESSGTLQLSGQPLSIGDLIGTGAVALGAGTLTIYSSSAGSTFGGSITGSGSLVKNGAGNFTLIAPDLATGTTTVNNGALTVASTASIGGSIITAGLGSTININGSLTGIPQIVANGTVNFALASSGLLIRTFGSLSVGTTGQVNVLFAANHASRTLIVPQGLIMTGTTNAWSGLVDLSNNDMIVNNGDIAILTNQVKSGYNNGKWNGNGITSSAAAGDTTLLTALGVIQNNNGSSAPIYGNGGSLGSFDGYNPLVSDVLIKYTYYGDANLDGKVDGSDYSLIDSAYLTEQTTSTNISGWYNGDFNYDGIVNGSDYTLIDNAYNSQDASLAAVMAETTSQIAPTTTDSVPEPTGLAAISITSGALLGRRRFLVRDKMLTRLKILNSRGRKPRSFSRLPKQSGASAPDYQGY